MDMNEYALEVLVRDRLAEMRDEGERSSRIRAASPESRPLRLVLGHALIRMGDRLRGPGAPRVTTDAGGAVERRSSSHGAVHG